MLAEVTPGLEWAVLETWFTNSNPAVRSGHTFGWTHMKDQTTFPRRCSKGGPFSKESTDPAVSNAMGFRVQKSVRVARVNHVTLSLTAGLILVHMPS